MWATTPRPSCAGAMNWNAAAGLAPRRFQYMNQVHGNHVAMVGALPAVRAPTADAMVSRGAAPGRHGGRLHSVVLVGDTGGAGPVLGVVHAGVRALASGVIPAAVDRMRAAGAGDIRAWLGPSICGHCYEVPAELRDDVAAAVPSDLVHHLAGERPALDLPAGCAQPAGSLAACRSNTPGRCTLEDDGLFSYRRDRRTGRFAGLVWSHELRRH